MKRKGYLFEKVIDIDNIKNAIKCASQHKRKSKNVQDILNNADYYANEIRQMLIEEKFVSTIICRKTIFEQDKTRAISVPKFYPDQIIHWAICLVLNPIFMKGMYTYNCGSVKGRGGIYGKRFIEKIYKKIGNKKAYIMKLDIKKYFHNISHEKLFELLNKKIKDKKMLKLLWRVIDCGEEGIPIGFYTSQWFANFYLEKLDHFIKEQLQIKYYVRYVDDMVLIDTNKRKLHKAFASISNFLKENNYKLEIKDNWQIWKIHSRPLSFLGFLFYKDKCMIRKKILKRLKRQLIRVKKEKTLKICRARSLCSYIGWIKHITYSRSFYIKYIKPIVSKKWISNVISHYETKRRYIMINRQIGNQNFTNQPV